MGLFSLFSGPQKPDLAHVVGPTTNVKDAIRDQQEHSGYQDCTPCRVMGATTFIGLGAYSLWSGRRQLELRQKEILKSGSRFGLGARYMSIYALSASLVGLGIYRMNN